MYSICFSNAIQLGFAHSESCHFQMLRLFLPILCFPHYFGQSADFDPNLSFCEYRIRACAKSRRDKLFSWLTRAVIALLILGVPCLNAQVTHCLKVSIIGDTVYSDQRVLSALREAQMILRADELPGDIRALITLSADFRNCVIGNDRYYQDQPSIETIPGRSRLTTKRAVLAAMQLPGYVKVVTEIDECDRPKGPGKILGCAAKDTFLVVSSLRTGSDRVVWTHEYGHSKELGHVTDKSNVMYGEYDPEAAPPATSINLTQCHAFVRPHSKNPDSDSLPSIVDYETSCQN